MAKLSGKIKEVEYLMRPFASNDWCYQTKRAIELTEMLDEEEKRMFNFDPRTINWKMLT